MRFLQSKFVFAAIFIFSLLTFFGHTIIAGSAIYGDGRFYYAITRSIVKDRDIRFENEYKELGIGIDHTPTGYVWNMYPPGTSLFWIPGFMITDGAVQTINLIPGVNLNDQGYSVIYQASVALSSIVLGILGLFLLFRFLKNYFPNKTSLLAVAALFGTTNLLFYISVEQINSHAVSFFVSSLFVFVFSTYYPTRSGQSRLSTTTYYFALGILGGIAGLVRTQDALILILPVVKFTYDQFKIYNPLQLPLGKGEGFIPQNFVRELSRNGLGMVIFLAIGFTLMFLPQILFWYKIFGTIGSPYSEVGFNFLQPQLIHTLLNLQNGLFVMTPAILAGLIGLFYLSSDEDKSLRIFALFGFMYFFLQLYLVSSWNSSIGGSYSIRTMITTYPLLVFGFAQFIKTLQKNISIRFLLISIILIAFINSLSMIRYLLLY